MISAVIGFENDAYRPIDKQASDGVLMQFFIETDYDLMDLIAYAHTKDQNILKSDDKYEIFSSYANGGFPILLQLLELDELTEINESKQEATLVKLAGILMSNDIILPPVENNIFI